MKLFLPQKGQNDSKSLYRNKKYFSSKIEPKNISGIKSTKNSFKVKKKTQKKNWERLNISQYACNNFVICVKTQIRDLLLTKSYKRR